MVDWTVLVDCMVIARLVNLLGLSWVGAIAIDDFWFVMAMRTAQYVSFDI